MTKPRLTPEQSTFLNSVLTAPPNSRLKLKSTAGSGKTTTLVSTIDALIAQPGFAPHQVLATSFTKDAAAEIKSRLSPVAQQALLGTFHAIGLNILRQVDSDKWAIEKCCNIYSNPVPHTKQIWRSITQWSREGVIGLKGLNSLELSDCGTPDDYALEASNLRAKGINVEFTEDGEVSRDSTRALRRLRTDLDKLGEAAVLYARAKRALKVWDFDDVLAALFKLVDDETVPLPLTLARITHIFIDEAQDNNTVQLAIAKRLADRINAVLSLIFDQRQAIYSWRGATPEISVNFEGVDHNLTANFRSNSQIVEVGNRVAADMPEEWRGEPAVAARGAANLTKPVQLLAAPDALDEAMYTALGIKAKVDKGASYSDFAILVRTNAAAGLYEAGMMQHHIPCVRRGTKPFFGRHDVQAFVAYAVLHSTDHWPAFDKIVNVPKRYLSLAYKKKVAEALDAEGQATHNNLIKAMAVGSVAAKLKRGSRDKARAFGQELLDLRKLDWEGACLWIRDKVTEAIPSGKSRQAGEDRKAVPDIIAELGKRFDNGIELAQYAAACEANALREGMAKKASDVGDRVEICTIHGAKGREWKHVYVSIATGLFPHRNSTTLEAIAEERRLFYVAVTRPKDTLTCTYPEQSMGETKKAIGPSVFSRYYLEEG